MLIVCHIVIFENDLKTEIKVVEVPLFILFERFMSNVVFSTWHCTEY